MLPKSEATIECGRPTKRFMSDTRRKIAGLRRVRTADLDWIVCPIIELWNKDGIIVRQSRVLIMIALAFVIASTTIGIGQEDKPLDRLLSKDQQVKLGVTTMRPEQRELLRQALISLFRQGYETGKRDALLPSAQTPIAQLPQVIESQVDGDFTGWDAKGTIVKLKNGQIWQQTDFHYVYQFASMPHARVYPSDGGYKMLIEGIDNVAVGVKRLK